MINQYQERSFKVSGHRSRKYFKCLETNILDAILDIIAKDGNSGSVERYMHTMKENLRCVL